MASLRNIIVPLFVVIVGFASTNISNFALFDRFTLSSQLDEPIREELERIMEKTVRRIKETTKKLPEKLLMVHMDGEDGNVFEAPFLTGNDTVVVSRFYLPPSLSNWCSGIVSRSTMFTGVSESGQIDILFSCDRFTLFSPLRFTLLATLCFSYALFDILWLMFVKKLQRMGYDHVIAEILYAFVESVTRSADEGCSACSEGRCDLQIVFEREVLDGQNG